MTRQHPLWDADRIIVERLDSSWVGTVLSCGIILVLQLIPYLGGVVLACIASGIYGDRRTFTHNIEWTESLIHVGIWLVCVLGQGSLVGYLLYR